MSAHTRMHPTELLYVTNGKRVYAIPEDIADKYIVDNVSSEVVFSDLEKRFTKAGVLLRGLRMREGLSQVNFAKEIKVTQANLSNMENGHRPIGKIIAKRIEKVFKVDYRYFLE